MSPGRLQRVAVVGATGTVGSDLLELLQARRFPLQQLVPIASDRSLGEGVEVLGEDLPVQNEIASLKGLDLIFLCTPRQAALDWIRRALHDEVPCIDLSGAVAHQREIPLGVAEPGTAPVAPLLSGPSAPALALGRFLAPLVATCGVRRAVATLCLPVSNVGRAGVQALEAETLALFNQQERPEASTFPHPIAFECVPSPGEASIPVASELEESVARDLQRLLGQALPLALAPVQVPTFAGLGITLAVELARPLALAACREALAKAPGVQLWDSPVGPGTRAGVGLEKVLVSRLRPDPSVGPEGGGLLAWLSADPVRLVTDNAVRLAEARCAES